MPKRGQLRLVDPKTGEITDECPVCDEWARKYNGLLSQLGKLRIELKGDTDHALFPAAFRLFEFWKERCNHPRTEFTPERFKAVRPHLQDLGEETCRRAIEGAAFDPWVTRLKNGKPRPHNGWTLIFRSRDKVEDFAERAPYHLPDPAKIKTLADALMFLYPDLEPDEAVADAQGRLRRLGGRAAR